MKTPRYSQALFSTILILVIVPLLALATLMIVRFHLNSIEQAEYAIQWHARNNASSLQKLLFNLERDNELLSSTKAIAELPVKVVYSQFALAQLQEFVQSDPHRYASAVIDQQGFIVEGYPISILKTNYTITQQILKNARAIPDDTSFQLLTQADMGDALASKENSHANYLLIITPLLYEQDSLSEPIKRTGLLATFVPLNVALTWLTNHTSQQLQTESHGQYQFITQQQVLAAIGPAQDDQAITFSAPIVEVFYQRKLSSLQFKLSEAKHLHLAAVKHTAIMAFVLIVSLIIICALLTRWLTRRLHTPLQKIAKLSRDFAAGDYRHSQDDLYYLEFKEIAQSLNTMATLIDEQISSLQTQKQRAETSERVKSQFLANMSHEIRTPMNGIVGFLQILKQTELNKEQANYVRQINNCSDVLLTVINDILDFSKVEAKKVELDVRACDVALLCRDLLALFVPNCQEKGIDCRFESNDEQILFVDCDEVRVKQILINLLSNAVKFTHRGEVVLRFHSKRFGDNAELMFEVIDTGIGIEEEKITSLFNPFVQAQSHITREFGGTGLGLAISKGLVDLMQGELAVSSKVDLGSTFYVTLTLPLSKQTTPTSSSSDVSALCEYDLSTIKYPVLVAEDNPINQMVIKTFLAKLAVPFEIAENGQQAWELAKKSRYSLVLMDIQMPVMDGFTAAEKLRSEPAFSTPIIAVSANAMPEDIAKCRECGMVDHIAKPINFDDLQATLVKWLSTTV